MDRCEGITQQQLIELLRDIYILGQKSEGIQTEDFIKVIEDKLLSILVSKA
jgi:hypothetical protein